MIQRKIPLILLALCLLLTACGKQQSGPVPSAGDAVYTADVSPCELPLTDFTAVCTSGGLMYLAGSEEEAPEDDADGDGLTGSFSYSASSDGGVSYVFGGSGQAAIYRLDPASGEAVKLDGYAPETGAMVSAMAPGADGSIWVLEETMGGLDSLESTEGSVSFFTPAPSSQVWRRLDASGAQELERIDITDLTQKLNADELTGTLVDGAGRLYAASGNSVTVLDSSGNMLFTCSGQEFIERLVPLADGAVGALTSNEAGRTLSPIDPDAKSWGTSCPLSGNASGVYAGDETRHFFYTSGDSLYSWPKDAGTPQKLLSWSGAGIDCSQVCAMTFLPDGRGAALLRDFSGWPVTYRLALLSPAGADALAGRTVLTLATLGLSSDIRARVLEFNRTNSQYRIEIQDYSEFNTADDASAGLTKLNTEILAGNMPDLLHVSDSLPLRQYAAKGYLEDLWPYIEDDPGLGREGVMEHALQAAEIDGKLYQVFSSFTLETAAGVPEVVGGKMGWTLQELQEARTKLPQDCTVIGPGETKASVLESLFSQNLDQFVDWTSGTARFDSREFREILEFCNAFPSGSGITEGSDFSDDGLTRVARGEQLLLPVQLSDFSSVQLYRALFGGGVTFVGYPGSGGSGARILADGGLALSAGCQEKDGAWSFLRQTLLPTNADFFSAFPINREDFDRSAADSMRIEYITDENGDPITGADGEPVLAGQSYVFLNDRMIKLEPVTREDYDQVMALYSAAGTLVCRDESVWTIVRECAGAYFAGDRTAEDTAGAIQSRVELYLNERK